jgi:hypothetical protein
MFPQDATDPGEILMIPVEAEFILDKKKDEDRAGKADGQTGDIDKGMVFLPVRCSQQDLEVMLDHTIRLFDKSLCGKCAIVLPGIGLGGVHFEEAANQG